MDNVILNWLKDVGIATATLVVLGRIMFLLVQGTVEFYRGVREDNRERNRQIEELLKINQAIEGQMALTRQTIAHSAYRSAQHEHTIRSSVDAITLLRKEVADGLDALSAQITQARQDILGSLERGTDGQAIPMEATPAGPQSGGE